MIRGFIHFVNTSIRQNYCMHSRHCRRSFPLLLLILRQWTYELLEKNCSMTNNSENYLHLLRSNWNEGGNTAETNFLFGKKVYSKLWLVKFEGQFSTSEFQSSEKISNEAKHEISVEFSAHVAILKFMFQLSIELQSVFLCSVRASAFYVEYFSTLNDLSAKVTSC